MIVAMRLAKSTDLVPENFKIQNLIVVDTIIGLWLQNEK